MVVAVWPNGSRTRPTLSSLWKQYDGVYAPEHYGLDMYGFKYNCAIAAGVITKIGYNSFGGGGHEVYLKLDGSGDVILYYHNEAGLLVDVGDRVVAGRPLGVQSDSGKTDGIHLHLEVWRNGYRSRRVNPLPYITKLVGTSPAGNDGATIKDQEEEEEMKASQVHWTRKKDGKIQRAMFVPGTPYWLTWQESGSAIANGFARNSDTGNSTAITESMATAMARASAALLPKGIDLGVVTVEVDSKELAATIEAGLKNDFAGIPGAVNDDAAKRLQN